jgi:GTP cyclohydrolase II
LKLTRQEIEALLAAPGERPVEGSGDRRERGRFIAVADLPSRFGTFQIAGFAAEGDTKEHLAILHGNPLGRERVPTRIHSECLTGDALGSLRCDCRDQLERSLRAIGSEEFGVVLYLRQEGRGIGLLNKVRAYALQDRGLDTVAANEALGFRDDLRDYEVAAHMLQALSVRSIRLFTNNPRKIEGLERHGVRIVDRIPHETEPNPHNRFYLETKRRRSGHLLELAESMTPLFAPTSPAA